MKRAFFCCVLAYFNLFNGLSFVYVQCSELKFDFIKSYVVQVDASDGSIVHGSVVEPLVAEVAGYGDLCSTRHVWHFAYVCKLYANWNVEIVE